ncbi:MAG TPA: MFS transporter [Actinopolymorphaceae bacterium]
MGTATAMPVVSHEGLLGPTYRKLTIGIITLVLMVAFEAMSVTTAMPVAVRDLDGLALYAWGFSGFMTASMFATVVAGQLADRLGPMVPFLGGLGAFLAGLVVAGVAPTMPIFVVGRAIQGLGGGALVVALFVVSGRAYPKDKLPKLMAAFSSAWVLPSIVGPFVAGVVTEELSWRLIFLGLLPFGILPLVLVLPRLRALPAVEPAAPAPSRTLLAFAAAVGIAAMQYAGQEMEWWSPILAVGGLALLVPSLPRLLPAGALRFVRGLPTVVGMRGLMAGVFFGAQSFLPLLLTEYRGLTTTAAGLMLAAGSLGWTSGSWWQGRSNLGMARSTVVVMGATFVTVGVVVILLASSPSLPAWVAVPGVIMGGLGMGLGSSSLQVLVLTMSSVEQQGVNSAGGQLADALGQVVFIGLGGVVYAALHQTLHGTSVFVPLFGLLAVTGVVAVILARRVATPENASL